MPYDRQASHQDANTPPVAQLSDACFLGGDGQRLLDGVSLRLQPGRRTALMGPNGSGKSLTLRALAGLLPLSSGEIRFDSDRTRQRVTLVLQRPVLLRRTVRANLDHALAAYGVPRAQRPARIDELLERARLTEAARRPARVLSGGEQQRLSMVRALAAEPALLLLDEPTASLDPHATHAIERLIAEAADAGARILLVTHDFGQAKRLSDEVIFLHRGRALEHTPTEAFFEAPQTAQAASFLAGRLLI